MKKLFDVYNLTKLNIKNANEIISLEKIRINFLGKNGILNSKIKELKNEIPRKKVEYGSILNKIKNEIHNKILKKIDVLQKKNFGDKLKTKKIDVSLPGRRIKLGSIHPINKIINELKVFFLS